MQSLITLLIFQTPRSSLSRTVIIGAALFLILGIAAVVYFFRRVKNTAKEAEEDRDVARRRLFSVETAAEKGAPEHLPSIEAVSPPLSDEAAEAVPIVAEQVALPSAGERLEPATRATDLLGSSGPAAFITDSPNQTRTTEPPAGQPADVAPSAAHEIAGQQPATQAVAQDLTAVHSHPGTAGTTPDDDFATPFGEEIWSELSRPDLKSSRPVPEWLRTKDEEVQAPLAGMVRGAEVKQSSSRAAFSLAQEPPGSVAAAAGQRAPIQPSRAGSVLGLSAEPSDKPLILGKASGRAGSIGTLSNYDKPAEEAGRGGTITLAVVILVIGGAVAAYFLSARLHSAVNDWVDRTRGVRAVPESEPAKAQIFPMRPELQKDKSQAVARGTVMNTSAEELGGLSVEVSLTKKDGAQPDSRNVAITPEKLAAGRQGTYEFDFDAGAYTGYRVMRLLNNDGKEIKFTTPAQQK